jgi:hypothetical protein
VFHGWVFRAISGVALDKSARSVSDLRRDRCANRLKVTVMDVSPIKTQRDYRNTLKAIEGLMAAKRSTPEGNRQS